MARTQIPEMTEERLMSRISIWLMSANNGDTVTIDRIETTVATLGIVGFTLPIVEQIIRGAATMANLNADDAVKRFVPQPKATVSKRKRKNGKTDATS